MHITSLRELYLAELQELSDGERQLVEMLKLMMEVVSSDSMLQLLHKLQKEAIRQEQRLNMLLQDHGVDASTHADQAMEALINETKKMSEMTADGLRNAALIASLQKVEHYEIAAYGSIATLAGQLGFGDDQRLLHRSLQEERRADKLLTGLAKAGINEEARAA